MIGYVLADKYQVLRVIGKGGMGIVYEAQHLVLGKHVAIKLMLEKYFGDPEAKSRFKREAIAASRVGNPHIIDVSDIGELPDGRLYVVMELLTGSPLSDVLEKTGPMQPQRAISIMRQVLRAVGAAHAKGIIHRDLKPDNIFLIDQGDHTDFVKLLDFGISKVLDPDEQRALTKLTTTGVVMGTPLYMAPEQAMGQPAIAYADIYACGVILYEMLAGRTPFVGNTYAVLVAQLLTAAPEPLQNVRSGLQASVVNAVHRALEKEPQRRFASAEMFAASLPGDRTVNEIELAGTLDSGYAVARITTGAHQTRKGRGTWIAIGAALILGVATAGILIATQTGASGDKTSAAVTTPAPPEAAGPTAKSIDPDPAPAPKKNGLLKVETTPPRASVIVDGSNRGLTPLEITLALGPHEVRLELEGYEPLITKMSIDPGDNNFRTPLNLAKLKPGITGIAKVATKPPGSTKTTRETPTSTSTTKVLTVTGPIGPKPPISEKPEPEIKKAGSETKQPPEVKPAGGGKGNPYTPGTKGNPYTPGSK